MLVYVHACKRFNPKPESSKSLRRGRPLTSDPWRETALPFGGWDLDLDSRAKGFGVIIHCGKIKLMTWFLGS